MIGMRELGTSLADFFDLTGQGHEELFAGSKEAWDIRPKIAAYLKKNLPK